MDRKEVIKHYQLALIALKKYWLNIDDHGEFIYITDDFTLDYNVKTKNPLFDKLKELDKLLEKTTSGNMFYYTFHSYNNPRLKYRTKEAKEKSKKLRMTPSHTYFEKEMYQPSAFKNMDQISRQLEFLLPTDSSEVRSVLPVLIISYILKYKESMDKSMDNFVTEIYTMMNPSSKIIDDKLRCFIPEPMIQKLKKCSYSQMTPIDIRMHRRRFICLIFAKLVLMYRHICNVTLCFCVFNELTGYIDVFLSPITLHVLSKFDMENIENDLVKEKICKVFFNEIKREGDICDFCVRCRVAKYVSKTGMDADITNKDDPGDDNDGDDDDDTVKKFWKETKKEERFRIESKILNALRFSLPYKDLKIVMPYLQLKRSLDDQLEE